MIARKNYGKKRHLTAGDFLNKNGTLGEVSKGKSKPQPLNTNKTLKAG